jgi:hypothetical protein
MKGASRLGWLAGPAVVLGAACLASAATVTYPDGKSVKLSGGNEVTGPCTVVSENGKDRIDLRKGAVLRYIGTETDAKGNVAEMLFLKSGAADVDTSFFTRVATSAFWAFPEKAGSRAKFYTEAFDAKTAYARTAPGSSLVRLVAGSVDNMPMEAQLSAEQGVTLQRSGESLRFTTDPHNAWSDAASGGVRVLYPLSTGLLVDLYVPKATSGSVGPKAGASGKTDVANLVTSWKSGKIHIQTSLGGSMTGEGDIGPGVTAAVDNQSGRIEIGFVKVEFATLKAAVSLTSEFASLATSAIAKP